MSNSQLQTRPTGPLTDKRCMQELLQQAKRRKDKDAMCKGLSAFLESTYFAQVQLLQTSPICAMLVP